MLRRKSEFSKEDRARIVLEFEESNLSGKEIAQKYGLRSANLVQIWRHRLRKSEKSSTFAAEIAPQMVDSEPMAKRTPEELEAEIKRLTKELEWEKLRNKALNTMIDIAEEQGLRIRKKSGAKQ
jgi:transposase-like protein